MKHTIRFNTWNEISNINEDGTVSGGAGTPVGSGDGGQGDGGSGVAYFNQGSIDGMGAIKNATVSIIPGDPSGSEAGSGDASVYLPAFSFTKNTGITGNKYHKKGKVKIDMNKINKVKDEMGVGKTKSFKDFINT